MNRMLIRCLLLAAMSAVLAACGGGGGSDGGSPNASAPQTAPHKYTPPTYVPPPAPKPKPVTPTEKKQLVKLVDNKNQFTVSVCPTVASESNVTGAIDQVACNNEALKNISLGNDNVLGLLCQNTVKATQGALSDDLNQDFIKNCAVETGAYLKDTLQGVLMDPGHTVATQALCPGASNIATCVVQVLKTSPDTLKTTLGDVGAIAGCDDPSAPATCVKGIAQGLAKGKLLLFTGSALSNAVCPLEARADKFDPQACLKEASGAVQNLLKIADAGNGLSGLTGALNKVPVLGDIFNQLTGAAAGSGLPLDPSQLKDIAGKLQSGDLSSLSAPLQDILQKVPTLGPVVGQLLMTVTDTASQCDPSDPASCAAGIKNAAGQLQQLTSLLNQVPVLGGVVNGLIGQLPIPGLPDAGNGGNGLPANDPLAMLRGALNQVPTLGPQLNNLLGTLQNAASGGLPTDQLNQIPVLGDLLNSVLGGLTSGQMPSLNQFPQMLQQVPVLGDIVSQLTNVGGTGSPLDPSQLKDIASKLQNGDLSGLTGPLKTTLTKIPTLGPIAGQLLDTVANTASQCSPTDPAGCMSALTGAAGQLQQLTGLLNQVPVLGGVLNGILGNIPGLPGGTGGATGGNPLDALTNGLSKVPAIGAPLNSLLSSLTDQLSKAGSGGLPTDQLKQIPVLGDLVNNLLGGLTSGNSLTGADGIQNLFGNLVSGTGNNLALIPKVADLVKKIPTLGDPLATVLTSVAGKDSSLLNQLLGPVASTLNQVPGLGPVIGGLLGTLGLG